MSLSRRPMPEVPKKVRVLGNDIPVHLPFHYSSLRALWVYYLVPYEPVADRIKGTGFRPQRFGDQALVNLNFLNYTAMLGAAIFNSGIEKNDGLEFNVVAVPDARRWSAPHLSLDAYLGGEDQTKTIGNYRLHVAASELFNVEIGKALFNEPKFQCWWDYQVPSLNSEETHLYYYSCSELAKKGGGQVRRSSISESISAMPNPAPPTCVK